ncbi:MAG: NAD(P)/FAD-dependent oxidoreductase [Clostridia bacterium]|nr:NAD(P)/FAD-dependent oxidoreductase [Clostridia bacterium]
MNETVIVVGAGAAGCMAAVTAAEQGAGVVLIDRNEKIGRKLMITGKGRCNVTNNCTQEEFMAAVTTNVRFLYSAYSAFNSQDTMAFFENNGVPLKTERGRRVFPQSDKAVDIVDCFFRLIKTLNIKLIQADVTSLIIEDNCVKGVKCGEKEYRGDSVILCCGGCSYPQTGSTGYGYTLAKQAGHTIIEPRASLVPIVTNETWCGELQGLSLRNVTLTLRGKKKKPLYSELGEMLFTHYGITGPLVLSASAHIDSSKPEQYTLEIDLKPGLNEEQLDKRILRDLSQAQHKDIINALDGLLPKRLIPVVLDLSEIDPRKKCSDITKDERKRLCTTLKSMTMTFKEFRPIAEAIVTKGGVNVKEVDPKTMGSKLCANLYFAGEILDVDAYTGGYNLQIAFSTGRAACCRRRAAAPMFRPDVFLTEVFAAFNIYSFLQL